MFSEFTDKSIAQVMAMLQSSADGLSPKEVDVRQRRDGLNRLNQRSSIVGAILARQVSSPFFYLLLAAGILSLFIGERVDSAVILIFVLLNFCIGFFQEFRAEHAIAMLKKIIPQYARVVREGKLQTVLREQLVAGDVVVLAAGDVVPAELRIIESQNIVVDESVLTGESLPVLKKAEALRAPQGQAFAAKNILFAGTHIISGGAKAVVIGTGNKTALGQIAAMAAHQNHGGAYEKNLMYFCRLILKIVVATMAVVFIANLLLHGTENFFSFSFFCIALVVSILPEALPAIVVFSLSRGSLKMAKEHVVVKRLAAIEDLGNMEILCTDKTGTLTENKLSLEKIISADRDKVLLYALLGIPQQSLDPFDAAFLARAGAGIARTAKKYQKIAQVPFDSFRMRSSVLVKNAKGETWLLVRGAPEVLLKRCSKFARGFEKKEILEDVRREGADGKRSLALAYKKVVAGKTAADEKDERDLTFLGYFVFEDPLKATAEESIRLSKKLGLAVKIITGDSAEVAGYVAKKVGLITNDDAIVSGAQLAAMSRDDFDDACRHNTVFVRISPDIKHQIIVSLQKNFEVGFLGEGINDAPALKVADVGIAVAEASDIARESADIVLLKKDLRVIINGIKDGRMIFANINKYIKCTLASNFGNFYSIATISLFVNFLPMLPVQILLGNLLSDFPLISIASDSVDIQELRKPKNYQLHMVLPLIISLALVSTVFDFIFFTIFYHQAPGQIQTLWFIESILTEIVLIFIIRTRNKFWKARRPGTGLLAFTAIDAIAIITLPFFAFGQEMFHFVRPNIALLLVVFFLVACYLVASEVVKLVYFHYFKPSPVVTL